MIRKILILGLVVLNFGCAGIGWKKIIPEIYVDKKRHFSASLPQGWMRYEGDKSFILTKDGIVLDAIYVDRLAFNEKLANTKKMFTSAMLPYELAEVEIDNFKSSPQVQRFEVVSNDAVKIVSKDAFKFVYRFQAIGGLWKRGIVYGFIHDNKVCFIQYEAAEQYYYDDNKSEFDVFVASLALI